MCQTITACETIAAHHRRSSRNRRSCSKVERGRTPRRFFPVPPATPAPSGRPRLNRKLDILCGAGQNLDAGVGAISHEAPAIAITLLEARCGQFADTDVESAKEALQATVSERWSSSSDLAVSVDIATEASSFACDAESAESLDDDAGRFGFWPGDVDDDGQEQDLDTEGVVLVGKASAALRSARAQREEATGVLSEVHLISQPLKKTPDRVNIRRLSQFVRRSS